MSTLVVIVEMWALLLISMLLGRRLVDLLPGNVARPLNFYVSPVLGLAVLVLIATLYGWISAFSFKITLPLTLALVVLAAVFEKHKRALLKDSVWLCLFAVICAMPVWAQIFKYGGYSPFTDIFTYIAQAQWLQEHPFTDKVITSGNYPALTQVALYQWSGSRMGGTFLLGFVQSLFNLQWSYYAYTSAVSCALVTGCLAIGGIIRHVIPSRRLIILALALLPSISMNGFIYGAEWGFYPQTLGLSFALGVCALFPFLIKIVMQAKPGFLKSVAYALPAAVSSAALLFAYNEPFPIFIAAIFLYLVIVGLQNRSALPSLLIFVGVFIVETLILVNYEAIRIFINIYQTLGISNGMAQIGWAILWSPIQFIAFSIGMKSPFRSNFLSLDYFYSTFFATAVLLAMLVILISFVKKNPKRRENIIFLACIEFVLMIFLIKFRYFSPDMSAAEVGHTFLQFKIAKYQTPFMMALVGIFWAICYKYFKAQRRLLIVGYFILFIIGGIFHFYKSTIGYTRHFLIEAECSYNPFAVLLELRQELHSIPKDKVVYVDLGFENHHKLRQMVAYILYDRKIAGDYRDDGYILGRLPEKDRNMSKDGAIKVIYMRENVKPQDADVVVGPFVIRDK